MPIFTFTILACIAAAYFGFVLGREIGHNETGDMYAEMLDQMQSRIRELEARVDAEGLSC